MLNKEQIETEKAYDDCSVILKEFDKDNCEFSKDIESLLNVYADAAKNVIITNFVPLVLSVFLIHCHFFFSSKVARCYGHKCPSTCLLNK